MGNIQKAVAILDYPYCELHRRMKIEALRVAQEYLHKEELSLMDEDKPLAEEGSTDD
jgi:hypothetical protein